MRSIASTAFETVACERASARYRSSPTPDFWRQDTKLAPVRRLTLVQANENGLGQRVLARLMFDLPATWILPNRQPFH